jgi:3-deoxy-D-manno-octulosonate 8-phosphate phosphatase KdsC-like HAD superfamily phosphatase
VSADEVCAVGDDLPDLPVLMRAGLAVAVADAAPEVRAAADHVTAAPGGAGAVREAIEWLMKLTGEWERVVESFRAPAR